MNEMVEREETEEGRVFVLFGLEKGPAVRTYSFYTCQSLTRRLLAHNQAITSMIKARRYDIPHFSLKAPQVI